MMSLSAMPYPPLEPPAELAFWRERGHFHWTQAEGRQFSEWLLGMFPTRTTGFLQRFGGNPDASARELLSNFGPKAAEILRHPTSHRTVRRVGPADQSPGGGQTTLAWTNQFELTDQGPAVARDMALLVARLLLRDGNGALQWKFITKPRRDINVNLTVVAAPDATAFEPIVNAPSTAISVLDNVFTPDTAWVKRYNAMLAKAR
jgi:hypothetical protein